MIINEDNSKVTKKPNAVQITKTLAQLGGGSTAEGGDGMMGGIENVFKKGYELGSQNALENKKSSGGLSGKSRKK